MPVIVIEPPLPVVELDAAKRHLRVDHDDDDILITGLIASATAWLDGPDGWLGRALGGQVLEWQGEQWPCRDFLLPFPPLVAVLSVSYVDPEGDTQSWAFPTPLYFENMPAVRGRPGDVKIRYRAGYGSFNSEDPPVWVNAIPAPIKTAILQLVAHWYETREAATADAAVSEVPFSIRTLAQLYRVYR